MCSLPIWYFGLTLQLFPMKKGTSILQCIMFSSKCHTVIPLDTLLTCLSLGIVIPVPCSYSLHIWQDTVLEAASTPLNRARAASPTKICPNTRASSAAADTEASGGRRWLLSVGKCGCGKGTKSFLSAAPAQTTAQAGSTRSFGILKQRWGPLIQPDSQDITQNLFNNLTFFKIYIYTRIHIHIYRKKYIYNRMVWVGRGFQKSSSPNPCHGQEHFPLTECVIIYKSVIYMCMYVYIYKWTKWSFLGISQFLCDGQKASLRCTQF